MRLVTGFPSRDDDGGGERTMSSGSSVATARSGIEAAESVPGE